MLLEPVDIVHYFYLNKSFGILGHKLEPTKSLTKLFKAQAQCKKTKYIFT